MKIWLKFLFIPLIYFATLFILFILIMLGIALGCGFNQKYLESCIRSLYVLFSLAFISAVFLGYLTSLYAPTNKKIILANAYNFIFSILIFVYISINKFTIPTIFLISFLFFICTLFGSFLWYLRTKKEKIQRY
jgi:cbb3-type cytochrome oxidase subunit 3